MYHKLFQLMTTKNGGKCALARKKIMDLALQKLDGLRMYALKWKSMQICLKYLICKYAKSQPRYAVFIYAKIKSWYAVCIK